MSEIGSSPAFSQPYTLLIHLFVKWTAPRHRLPYRRNAEEVGYKNKNLHRQLPHGELWPTTDSQTGASGSLSAPFALLGTDSVRFVLTKKHKTPAYGPYSRRIVPTRRAEINSGDCFWDSVSVPSHRGAFLGQCVSPITPMQSMPKWPNKKEQRNKRGGSVAKNEEEGKKVGVREERKPRESLAEWAGSATNRGW